MSKFRNAILCDDIREEAGNKTSLMGVFSGDVVVPSFPASINVAFFLQYFLDESDPSEFSARMRLLDGDKELAKFAMNGVANKQNPDLTFLVQRGVATFDKETVLRVLVAMNDGQEEEVLRKKISLAASISSPSAGPPG